MQAARILHSTEFDVLHLVNGQESLVIRQQGVRKGIGVEAKHSQASLSFAAKKRENYEWLMAASKNYLVTHD
uniref:Uncharacterized protein n=1 Tax=Gloeothece verrucosa (strain PCC 7822) TaxID=497965 RepID=E0U6D5_GLOV7|nr:hypothetical protein Cyan7822_1587 [Gloeothece verrucosa PCC 7822]